MFLHAVLLYSTISFLTNHMHFSMKDGPKNLMGMHCEKLFVHYFFDPISTTPKQLITQYFSAEGPFTNWGVPCCRPFCS